MENGGNLERDHMENDQIRESWDNCGGMGKFLELKIAHPFVRALLTDTRIVLGVFVRCRR